LPDYIGCSLLHVRIKVWAFQFLSHDMSYVQLFRLANRIRAVPAIITSHDARFSLAYFSLGSCSMATPTLSYGHCIPGPGSAPKGRRCWQLLCLIFSITVASCLLCQSGDVETNPGPTCECNKTTDKSNHPAGTCVWVLWIPSGLPRLHSKYGRVWQLTPELSTLRIYP
jgi:hypothetical protein